MHYPCHKVLFLLFIFINSSLYLLSQPVHISGSIDSKDLNRINIYQLGIKTSGEQNRKISVDIKPDGTFASTIKNIDEGMYRIGDAFIGHKIFISPGDVVRIDLKKIAMPSYEIFYKMVVDTRWPMNYMFFDSCLSFFGHNKPEFSKSNFDADNYKDECKKRYQKAMDLLIQFKDKKLVSDKFFKYANIELNTNYFLWLEYPFVKFKLDPTSVDPAYFNELASFSFDNIDGIEKTQYYIKAAMEYNDFIMNRSDDKNRELSLYSSFKTAARHFKDFTRDLLLAWKIDEIIRLNPVDSSALQGVLTSFLEICKTQFLRNEIVAKAELWKRKLKSTPTLFKELMNKDFMVDIKGKKYSMNTLSIKKNWLIIDCWASWCKPCKIQEPFFEKFRYRYQDRIAFLSLSLDKDTVAWITDIQKYDKNPAVNYLLTEGEKNAFTTYFNITVIPRFILIDLKNMKVVNSNMPFPANKEAFEQAINHGVQKQGVGN